MKNNNKEIIVKYRKEGYNFEIFVDVKKALEFKEGKIKDAKDVLTVHEIFKDSKSGERASRESLKKAFGTEDIYKAAEEILKNADIPIPTEYKKELTEQKKKQVIEQIRRICIDGYTNAPLTYERIEELIKKVKYNIDPFKPTEKQAEEIIKEIKKIYPIKIEYKRIKVIIPSNRYKIINLLKGKYHVIKEDWGENYLGIFEVPVGLISEFYSDLSKLCGGECNAEEIRQ